MYDKIESSGHAKQDVVAEALRIYFDINVYQKSENKELVQALQEEIESLRKQLELSSQEKLEALRLLNQSQILQMQMQKQLTEAQGINQKSRKWWKFWQRD